MDNRDNWYLWSVGLLLLTIIVTGYIVWYGLNETYSWGSFIAISIAYFISICGALLAAICGLVSYLKKGRKTKSLTITVICFVAAIVPPAYKEYHFIERDKQAQKAYQARLKSLTPTQHLYELVKVLSKEENRSKFIQHLENGANINNSKGSLLIMNVSSMYGDKGGVNTLDFLVKHGADVNLKSEQGGRTALHSHSWGSDYVIVKKLLELGADVNIISNDGYSPLHSAVRGSTNFKIIKLLIESGVNIDAQDKDGRTVLHYAVRSIADPQKFKMLIEQGVNLNAQDNAGLTALHYAVQNFRMGALDILIKHGADTTIVSNNGKTPLGMAREIHERHTEGHITKSVNQLIDVFVRNKSLDKIAE